MNPILKAIERHVASAPASVALAGDNLRLSYAALQEEIQNCCARLQHAGIQRLGLLMDNNPAWAVVDLAALSQRIVLVPLPAFFSDEQLIHAINSAGLDSILTDQPSRLAKLLPESRLRPWPRIAGRDVWLTALSVIQPVMLPADTAKITFTSGTTGQPKGVCLTEHTIMNVAQALAQLIDIEKHDRHLCLLPLAVLLENIAGLYVALLRGVPCSLPSMDKLGSDGASGIDVMKMFSRVAEEQATSVIMIPQMLQALVMCVEQGLQLPQLRFAAVGGASVSPQLLERALQLGLPVYEGYGLSECASVVAVNNPQAKRPGSVGRPLPHVRVTIADDGEILIDADVYAGYLGEAKRKSKIPLATGDLGHLDEDGYLYVTGRKKNVYITSFGRNVSPEWVESELSVQPAIAQAVVFGEAQPWATAVVVPRSPATTDDIDVTIHSVNQGLPEYARIGHWLMADEAFTPLNEQLTANGRPRRDVIWRHYADRINQLYENQVVNG